MMSAFENNETGAPDFDASGGGRESEGTVDFVTGFAPDIASSNRLPPHPGLGEPSHRWPYRNAFGDIIGYQCRFDIEKEGKAGKEFRPYFDQSSGANAPDWRWKGPKEPRPLYNLDQLTIRSMEPIVICEGEKAADAAAKLFPDHVTTTPMNGAQSPSKTDWSAMKGRQVIIAGDNDEAGRKFVDQVAQLVLKAGAWSVEVMDIAMIGSATIDADTGKRTSGDPIECPAKYDLADALADGWTANEISDYVEANGSKLLERRLFPHWPFRVGRDRVEQWVETKGFTGWKSVFTSMTVLGRVRTDSSEGWSYLLEVKDADGVCHEELVSAADLNGKGLADVRAMLASVGLRMLDRQYGQSALPPFIEHFPTDKRFDLVDKTGWHSYGIFVTPAWVAGSDPDVEIYFDEKGEAGAGAFEFQGDLDGWKNSVATMVLGNPLMEFSICLALAPMLLEPMQAQGFGIHYFGPSSCGKTTALYAAASVWGHPERYVRTWNHTTTALEGTAVNHNHAILCLDEVGQANPDDVNAAAYMLANGQGKGRGTVTGTVRERANWSLILASNGEVPFDQHIKSASGRDAKAGQKTRIINIPADGDAGMGIFSVLPTGITQPGDFANELKKAAAVDYGYPAHSFAAGLIEMGRDAVANKAIAIRQAFIESTCSSEVDGQVRRVATHFGLVAAAGELAIEMGLLPWPPNTAIEAAETAFLLWLIHRGGTEADEVLQGLNKVATFLEKNGPSRFTPMHKVARSWSEAEDFEQGPNSTRDRCGYRCLNDQDEWDYFVFPQAFRGEICEGLDAKMIAKEMAKRGYLKVGRDGKYQVAQRLPHMGTKKVYHIRSLFLAEQGEAVTT